MPRELNGNVWVDGRLYRKGQSESDVGDAATRIGDHAWVEVESGSATDGTPAPPPAAPSVDEEPSGDDESDEDAGDGALNPPPQAGPGSSGEAWRAYAASVGVEVPTDAKRDDVIDLIRMAGKPV
jgi:hypothetical protein